MKTENKIKPERLGASLALTFAVAVAIMFAPETANARVQRDESGPSHGLKIVVRDRKGRPLTGADVMVGVNGAGLLLPLDRNGARVLDVTDDDSILLAAGDNVYDLPAAGLDSLHVIFRNRRRLGFVLARNGANEEIRIGFGTVDDNQRTTAVGSLDVEKAESFTDLKSYMAGRIAGLQFMGDEPVIRGLGSLHGSNEALIVVDGIIMPDFATVNANLSPSEVANVSVLKDGSSAIYGSRAANGVILITTRSASHTE
ncbi:MAG: TonB-dependent receptor plug domain-containing protein [Alistipes sp.]|jgi:TonB-dependent SusC/RagA subfamily outer membrane receptor|nr:TonB-dependent receptor plug domain-containing protein [Alistipes sp.]